MKQSRLNAAVIRLNAQIERSPKAVLWSVLLIYVIALAIISYFHEPWFDEAQSWLIARDASYRDILFNIPHNEGHPPLWHLYLSLFAKSGLPYEFGLKLAAILINALAMGILLFKAPFPKIVRFTIPFTYYFFYQYGVISRCYSLTMLGFVLCALLWRRRNEKPFRLILAMMLVCASTAYGIVLCAGIALVWLVEIWGRRGLGSLVRDKRIWALFLLLIFALAMICLILPNQDTFATNVKSKSSLLTRLVYMYIFVPTDALLFNLIPGSFSPSKLTISVSQLVFGTLVFASFAFVIFQIARGYGKLALLAVPSFLFSFFGAFVYFYVHHIGILTFFFLFWFWVCLDDKCRPYKAPGCLVKLCDVGLARYRAYLWLLPALLIVVPLSWSVTSSVEDVTSNYVDGRDAAAFIQDNGLENCRIMTSWATHETNEDIDGIDIFLQHTPTYNAYFDRNISFSFNHGADGPSYTTHIVPTEAETEAAFALWASEGAPDVLIGSPDLESVYGDAVDFSMYSLVHVVQSGMIVKGYQFILPETSNFGGTKIYLRNDLLDKYGLTALEQIGISP